MTDKMHIFTEIIKLVFLASVLSWLAVYFIARENTTEVAALTLSPVPENAEMQCLVLVSVLLDQTPAVGLSVPST